MERKEAGKKWIQKAHLKKGALHEELGVPESKGIPEKKLSKALNSSSETLRKRAQFAENAKHFKH